MPRPAARSIAFKSSIGPVGGNPSRPLHCRLFFCHETAHVFLNHVAVKFNLLFIFLPTDSFKIEKCQAILIIDSRKGLSSFNFSLFIHRIAQCPNSFHALFLHQLPTAVSFQDIEDHPVRFEIGLQKAREKQQFSKSCRRNMVGIRERLMGYEYSVIDKGLKGFSDHIFGSSIRIKGYLVLKEILQETIVRVEGRCGELK